MFGGWFALFGVSYLVYRCEKANNRRPMLWVPLSWALIFGVGFATGLIVCLALLAQGHEYLTDREGAEALAVPTGLGMLAGAIVSVRLANRPADRPLRFSLRALLIATTLWAVGLAAVIYLSR
jgi:hypothetical protein